MQTVQVIRNTTHLVQNVAPRSLPLLGRISSNPVNTTCKRCAQTMRSLHKPKNKSFVDGGYILLAIPIATFGLGTWQVRRREWKLNLIKNLEEKTRALPIPFPFDTDELKDLEYRKVIVRGTYDHSKELYLQPRSLKTNDDSGGGMVSAGRIQTGAHVVTPFKLSDTGMTILINRGWVPMDKMNPKTRQQGQIEGEVELYGVVRHTEKRPQFGVKNDPIKNRWFNRDIEEMAEIVDSMPIFLDADTNGTVPGGPIGGQTRVTLRNEHLSYIFTWYSLSAITSYMWFSRYFKK